MSSEINQITTEATSITDNSVMPIDTELTGVYTTQKTKWSTIKTLVRSYILNIANTFTKQIKIISDGTNSPLVVRDSTDTSDLLKVNNLGSIDIVAPTGQYYPGITLYNNGGNIQATLEGYIGIAWRSYAGMSFVYSGGADVPNSVFSIGASWNALPNYSSVAFAVTSTTKGVLLPRLTTTQRNAISTPATSLLLFNTTTNQYEFYNGTAWVGLGGGGASWGAITGTLSSQTDLQTALDTKAETVANIGTIGSGLFKDKTGTTLNFRNIANAGGIGVSINPTDNTIELLNQHSNIVDMNDTFFGTLVANDLIKWDGTAWVNVQPTTLPISTATQTALDLKQDKPSLATVNTTNTTPTQIFTIPIPTTSDYGRFSIAIKGSSATNKVTYTTEVSAQNVAGTVSLVGAPTLNRHTNFSPAGATNVTFAVSGTNVIVNVVGIAGAMSWEAKYFKLI